MALRRFTVGILSGLLVAASFIPMAVASAAERGTGTFEDEGWWLLYRDPLGPPLPQPPETELGVSQIPRATVRGHTNQYKGEFMRVSANAGEPEAFTAVTFPLFELGGGLEPVITGGSVTFFQAPESAPPGSNEAGDDAFARGQRNAAGAEMAACLVTEPFVEDYAGNWEEAPVYDEETCSPLVLKEGSDPREWTVDLQPFVAAWSDPLANFGLAIVPDPESEAPPPAQTFHVAFDKEQNRREDAKPPVFDVTYEKQELDLGGGLGGNLGGSDDFPDFGGTGDAGGDDFASDFDAGAGSADFGSSDFSSGDAGFDAGAMGAEAPVLEDVGGEEVAAAPEVASDTEVAAAEPPALAAGPAQEAGVRTNPMVYLLPFLAVGLAGLLGYSLTQQPELAAEREGAVTKLMRQRRSAARPA